MSSPKRSHIVLVGGIAVLTTAAALLLTGDEQGPVTALVAATPTRAQDGSVTIEVECAADLRSTVDATGGVEGLPLVTIWGRPEVGRCRPTLSIDLPVGADRFQDGASGMVSHIAPASGPTDTESA